MVNIFSLFIFFIFSVFHLFVSATSPTAPPTYSPSVWAPYIGGKHPYWRLTIKTLSSNAWETYIGSINFYNNASQNIYSQVTQVTTSFTSTATSITYLFDDDENTITRFPPNTPTLPVVGDYLQIYCPSKCSIDTMYMYQQYTNGNHINEWYIQYSDDGTQFTTKWTAQTYNYRDTSSAITNSPTASPTRYPTRNPTVRPTIMPTTKSPTFIPSQIPTMTPTVHWPTSTPTRAYYDCSYYYWRLSVKRLSLSGFETYISNIDFYDQDGSYLNNRITWKTSSPSMTTANLNSLFDHNNDTHARFPEGRLPQIGDYLEVYCSLKCNIHRVFVRQISSGGNNIPAWNVMYSLNGTAWVKKFVVDSTNQESMSVAPNPDGYPNCTVPYAPQPTTAVPTAVPTATPTGVPTIPPSLQSAVTATASSSSSSSMSTSTMSAIGGSVAVVVLLALSAVFYFGFYSSSSMKTIKPIHTIVVEAQPVETNQFALTSAQSMYDLEGQPINAQVKMKPVSNVPVHKTHCFLSHNWGRDTNNRDNHNRVRLINEALKKRGLVTWFDADRMTGDVLTRILEGLENTSLVLIFVTERYREKINGPDGRDFCKVEYEKTFRSFGPQKMLPVVMEPAMLDSSEWKGLLSIIQGNLYIDFSEDFDENSPGFLEKIENLENQIRSLIGQQKRD